MKKLVFIFLIFFCNKIFSIDTEKCTIHFVGKMSNLSLERDNEFIIKDLLTNPLDLSTKNLSEPIKFSVIDKTINRKVSFYLETGSYAIEIRTLNFSVKSLGSRLNTEYFQFLHLIDSFNILMSSGNSTQLEIDKTNCLYNWCLQHTKSFVCFDFIQYQLQEQLIDSNLVRNLFNKLDLSMFEYPTYKKYKSIFESSNLFEIKPDTIPNHGAETTEKEKENINELPFKTQTTLKVVGKNIKNYQLLINNEVVIDILNQINLIKKRIAEPIRVSIMNLNDTVALKNRNLDYINFYLDIGVHDITINLDKSTFTSKSSKLSRENNQFWQLKKKYDTIIDSLSKLVNDEKEKLSFITNDNRFDSILHLYNRAYYNKCLLLPKSFISLAFVKFLTGGYLQSGITKQEVVKLFKSLDKSLFKYPTYIETKKIIEANFIKSNSSIPTDTIAKPLWNPK